MKSKSKFIMGMMILIIILFSSSVFAYKTIIDTIKSNSEKTIEAMKEEQFKVIWSSMHNLQLQSEKEVSRISSQIQEDILALPEDKLKRMQYDMTNNIHNNDLHIILMRNIENQSLNDINNHRNGLVVMSTKGYMEDFNYRRANSVSTHDSDSFRVWKDSIENSYNKELEQNAIDKMLNRTSGIIALESYDLVKNNDHIKIKEMNYESLLEVFLAEGMEGLRNYQIFVPYYITDIGDIFGVPDISQGIMVSNNKIIIVQEFNLYDQIMANQNEIFNDNQIKNLTDRYNNLLRLLYIFGIMLIMAVCGVIFYFCSLYNSIVEYEEKEKQLEIEMPRTDKMQKHSK